MDLFPFLWDFRQRVRLLHVPLILAIQSPIIIHPKIFQWIIFRILRASSKIWPIPLVPRRVLIRIQRRIHFPNHFNRGILTVIPSLVLDFPLFLQKLMVVVFVLQVMNLIHILMHFSFILIDSLKFHIHRLRSQYRRQVSLRPLWLPKSRFLGQILRRFSNV